MRDREPTIQSRELSDGLRAALRQAGLSARRVVALTGWSDSKVSRLLNGKRGTREDVETLLSMTHTFGTERDRLLALVEQADNPGLVELHQSRVPVRLATLIRYENEAEALYDFNPTVIPGLLQTEEYARALLSGIRTLPPDEIEPRVVARMARRSVFKQRPRCSFYITEPVLCQMVGGSTVMRDQLRHLLDLNIRSYIKIRVLPVSAGPVAAVSGAFCLMEFTEFNPITYVENYTANMFLETAQETAAYRDVLQVLADASCDAEESRELIVRIAVERYS